MTPTKHIAIFALSTLLATFVPTVHADDPFTFRGPIPTRDREPLNEPFLAPNPIAATVLKKHETRVEASLDISNNLENVNDPAHKYITDFEEQRLTLGYARGLGHRSEIGVQLPLIAHNRGLLDKIIENYDSFFGLKGNDRKSVQNFGDTFNVTDGSNRTIIDDEKAQIGIGDTTLEYRVGLTPDINGPKAPRLAIAARGLVKLPTGAASHLFGSGGTDYGIGVAGSWRVSHRLALHGNLTEVVLGKPKDDLLNTPHSLLHSVGALEYALGHRINFVMQVDSNPTPVRLGYDIADRNRRSLTMGIWKQMSPHKQYFVSFSENKLGTFGRANDSNAPDFVLSMGLRVSR